MTLPLFSPSHHIGDILKEETTQSFNNVLGLLLLLLHCELTEPSSVCLRLDSTLLSTDILAFLM